MTQTFFLIRHGETNHNLEKRFQGHMDTPLNENGVSQAEKLFSEFILRPQYHHPIQDALNKEQVYFYSSDLQRASITAQSFFEGFTSKFADSHAHLRNKKVEYSEHIREYRMGIFQDHTYAEVEKKFPSQARAFMNEYDEDPFHTPYPGGESKKMVWDRVQAFLQGLPDAGCIFIFSHGGTLRVAFEILTQIVYEGRYTNCQVIGLKKANEAPERLAFKEF